jgi:hypothetical protein
VHGEWTHRFADEEADYTAGEHATEKLGELLHKIEHNCLGAHSPLFVDNVTWSGHLVRLLNNSAAFWLLFTIATWKM